MALYVCSDLHGEYELFCSLLERINFGCDDEMIICGDVLDKGVQSIRLIRKIMSMTNVHLLRGNHEEMFLNFYHNLMEEADDNTDYDLILLSLQNYFHDDDERVDWKVIDFLDCLPYFIERDSCICVHAGVRLDEQNRVIDMEKQDSNILVYDRSFKSRHIVPQNSKTIYFGHTPTFYENNTGRIIKMPGKVQLDSGVTLSGVLGCVRTDDMQEFYVGI